MPAEPISAANLDITERFFKSVKVNDDDDVTFEEEKEEKEKKTVEK